MREFTELRREPAGCCKKCDLDWVMVKAKVDELTQRLIIAESDLADVLTVLRSQEKKSR